jgi:branched-chain amino acid transport system permease protein
VHDFLSFTITGLALGSVYAIGASGLVLTYTTTGIFNFSHGAIGMLGAFTYWELRFAMGWPAWLSLILVLFVLAPAFGALLEIALFRTLQGTSEAVKLVVTVSLLFSFIGLANWLWKPESRNAVPFFGQDSGFTIFGVPVRWFELIRFGCAIFVAATLWYLLYRTRVGIAMRATVDDRPLASLNGARPDRSALFAWAIGCSLAALAGVLFLGDVALDPTLLSLLIVNSYAAAIFGRLRNLPMPMTFLGAGLLGLLVAYLQGYLPNDSPYFSTQFALASPIIVLYIVLLAMPSSRLRAHGVTRTREHFPVPSLRGMVILTACVFGGSLLALPLITNSNAISASKLFAYAIIALSLVPLIGLAGHVSLAQYSLAGIGAVTMAAFGKGGTPMGFVWAIVVCAIVGGLVALPAIRLSGIYLALSTAAFAVFMDRWVWNIPTFHIIGTNMNVSLFGTGSVPVAQLNLFGLRFDTEKKQMLLGAVLFLLCAFVVVWIRRSSFGQRLLAMKDSEAACATVGMNLTRMKLAVFMVSAAMAGLGGAYLGGVQTTTTSADWDFARGLPIFMLAVVGGVGRIGGALFAGVSFAALLAAPAWPLFTSRFLNFRTWYANLANVTPGLMGVGLGRNPNGAASDMRDGFEPIVKSKWVMSGVTAFVGIAWVIAWRRHSGWDFIIGIVVVLLIGAGVAEVIGMRKRKAETAHLPKPTPIEWVGIDRPFDDADRDAFDKELGYRELVSTADET